MFERGKENLSDREEQSYLTKRWLCKEYFGRQRFTAEKKERKVKVTIESFEQVFW